LRRCRKTVSDVDEVTLDGRLFHTREAATGNARSPMVGWDIYRMCKYKLPMSRLSKVIVRQTDRQTDIIQNRPKPRLFAGGHLVDATESASTYSSLPYYCHCCICYLRAFVIFIKISTINVPVPVTVPARSNANDDVTSLHV